MGLIKFKDSNILSGFHTSEVLASADVYNGYQFGVSGGQTASHATDDAAKAGDTYVMMNIIDKPEITGTDDFLVESGEYIRAFRLKDYRGKKIHLSQDLVYFRDTGTKQVETATVVLDGDAVDASGNVEVVVTANGMKNSPKSVSVGVIGESAQVETATVVLNGAGITGSGDAKVVVTANGMENSPKTVKVPVVVGTEQVETLVVIGTVGAGGGNAAYTITSALIDGGVSGTFDVAESDSNEDVAGKFITELGTVSEVTDHYVVSGSGANVILTAKVKADNDTSLEITLDNGTCTGLTPVTSTETTEGVATDDAFSVAEKFRFALESDADIGHAETGFFTVSGVGENIILTANTVAENDDTMNIAIDNDTCTGITAAALSDNTVAGVIGDTANGVATKIKTALTNDADIGHEETGFFTVSGDGANIVLTAKTATANDSTMNISIADDTCVGITTSATSTTTTDGRVPVTTNALMWADLTVGDYLVPRVTADTDYPMKWKKASSITGYGNYLKVIKKTTFGAFTVDADSGTILGGLLCEII